MAQLRQGFGRTKSIALRLTPGEYEVVAKASKRSRSVADYVRGVVVAQAEADRQGQGRNGTRKTLNK